ncbi:hypothetical protein CYMTET_18386 [Cymbomonas tetramitiformis]|uniref:Uncharacterized protein n=1 Tax=Cymbomonas tetramitiformis TaxID=36881 RepID=A0AAE0G8H8_9CHLO|nr:hypothetical protein CYMTET_18386 [Cymbomonas tetramitiformis]
MAFVEEGADDIQVVADLDEDDRALLAVAPPDSEEEEEDAAASTAGAGASAEGGPSGMEADVPPEENAALLVLTEHTDAARSEPTTFRAPLGLKRSCPLSRSPAAQPTPLTLPLACGGLSIAGQFSRWMYAIDFFVGGGMEAMEVSCRRPQSLLGVTRAAEERRLMCAGHSCTGGCDDTAFLYKMGVGGAEPTKLPLRGHTDTVAALAFRCLFPWHGWPCLSIPRSPYVMVGPA